MKKRFCVSRENMIRENMINSGLVNSGQLRALPANKCNEVSSAIGINLDVQLNKV